MIRFFKNLLRGLNLKDEEGSLAIELAVIAPILIVGFLLLIVYSGRITQVENDLKAAAHSAARAASIRQNEASAYNAAAASTESNLTFADLNCRNPLSEQLEVTWNESIAGVTGLNFVTVRLVCDVSLSDFVFLGVPGGRTFKVTVSEVIDRYRA